MPTKIINFIGVTTGQSSVNRLFPKWVDVMGHPDATLVGIDHPINDNPAAYRQTVEKIKADPNVRGALITTHKLSLTSAARDLFDHFDPLATLTEEVSCIAKKPNGLWGFAKDPITSGQALTKIIGDGYFGHTGAEVLCLGAGGAALATLLHLLNQPDPANQPKRFVAVDIDQSRLDHMQALVEKVENQLDVDLRLHESATDNDQLMGEMGPNGIVINATGMGKDRPGSPLTDAGVFPENGVVWEFNYRGERQFLQQAKAQAASRNLQVVDGWDYFILGWLSVITEVLNVPFTPQLLEKIKAVSNR